MRITRQNLEYVLGPIIKIEDRSEIIETWHRLIGEAPPRNMSVELMKRVLAYRLQERVLGGLRPATRRRLYQYVDEDVTNLSPMVIDASNKVRPGTKLIREWHGRIHEVSVETNGVIMNGRRYRSLSEVARTITGAHWSGPRFFGIGKVKSA